MDRFSKESCNRGHHVYKSVWHPTIGEELDCRREVTNPSDRYAVAVVKDGTIVGHLPKKLSRLFSIFLRSGSVVRCLVTGARTYSADLPQGGLEVPCTLIFDGKGLNKLKKLLQRKGNNS